MTGIKKKSLNLFIFITTSEGIFFCNPIVIDQNHPNNTPSGIKIINGKNLIYSNIRNGSVGPALSVCVIKEAIIKNWKTIGIPNINTKSCQCLACRNLSVIFIVVFLLWLINCRIQAIIETIYNLLN
jgi:hypothetical protein